MEQVFVFLQQFTPIPENVRAAIARFLFPVQFGKDDYLVEEGTVNRDLFFVTKGLVNCFFLDKQGLKKTTLILKEGDIIAFAESYYTQTLNFYNVQALEPVEALRISFEAIEQICREPSF